MRKRTTKQFVAALIGSAALLLAACGGGNGGSSGGGDEGKPVVGGEISVGLEAEINGLRPWDDQCTSSCYTVLTTIYDKLLEAAAAGGYEPYLAESLESNETLDEWTLKLRKGVVFHDGTPLTAQTIVDMFEVQKTGRASAGAITNVQLTSVEVVDELTVIYKLAAPLVSFPTQLERAPLGMVFEPKAAAADIDNFNRKPIGTGPFKLESRDPDAKTVVVKNADYWRKDANGVQMPYLDKIIFTPIPDEQTRLSSVETGTVNLGQTLRQATIRDARAIPDKVVTVEYQGNNTGGGFFNTAIAPYDDVRVRMGLNMANNQAAVIVALGGEGISSPATQWFSPDSPWWSQKAADSYPKYDIAAATAKLKEYIDDPTRSDGKPVGSNIAVELSCPPDPTLLAAMQVVAAGWEATKVVEVKLTGFDQATHVSNAQNDNFAAHCWRWGGEGDPQAGLAAFLSEPVQLQNPPNWSEPAKVALEAVILAAGETSDVAKRKAAFEEIMISINENAVTWYSGHTATAFITQLNVKGLASWTSPNGARGVGVSSGEGRIWNVWIAAS